MKIAFFTVLILECGGGLEKYFIETASKLAKMPSVKTDVVTMDDKFTINIVRLLHIFYMSFTTKIDKKLIYKENTRSIRNNLGDARYFKVNSIANLRKKMQEYDLIYCKNEVLEAFVLKFLVGYKNLPPVIFGCHTPFYYPYAASLQSKLHNFLYNSFVYKFLASNARAFHVINAYDEKHLKKLLPEKKIARIYNPLDNHDCVKLSKKYKFSFKWDKTRFNILWAARLTEQKGVPELLWLIDYLNSNGYKDRVVFNIVGDGSEKLREDIKKSARKWDNVNFFGHVQFKYMSNIYSNNDLFISTSRWESFGLSLLEAQSFGLAAVSFDIPGSQDIILDKKTGFLVNEKDEFAKKIITILLNPKIFKSNTIKKVIQDKFNPKKIYNQLWKTFLELNNNQ